MTWTTFFGPELQTKDGVFPTDQVLEGKKYVGIYFSAHWCPPCRGFTPLLSESYEQFIEDDIKDVAIVFVSSDKEDASFNEYYNDMPFYALPFKYREQKDVLAKQVFEVKTIPTLVFLDAAGKTVTKDGRQLVVDARGDPTRVLAALAAVEATQP
ncbi:hypothetical protein H257_12887 [Aphanomyces astaci]|uniref:protein-disulfide reductase n=1 Tax=Aphanomyces astaci TaxID=112090 RepID=W4FYP8_APHAT|nr:hypothetical protein H257_12887 [Aphanomyces astaci]ETV72106.1 hypothetical protein H257_12887 [Aphanomyces astaci]RHY20860.1 hypothetical protein DYB36_011196 [Aphanomyces astaci]RQM23796.1 hypothetical protein B5M09_007634 [Aphanomyces astaci]|eukprot:XP_009838549.1 hypothetical protein H257_12887 [Aphanomyces astaci]